MIVMDYGNFGGGCDCEEVVCDPQNIRKRKSLSTSYRRLVCYIHVWMARRPVWECVRIREMILGQYMHGLWAYNHRICLGGNPWHYISFLLMKIIVHPYYVSTSHRSHINDQTFFRTYVLRARPSSDWFNDGPIWRNPWQRSLVLKPRHCMVW